MNWLTFKTMVLALGQSCVTAGTLGSTFIVPEGGTFEDAAFRLDTNPVKFSWYCKHYWNL